MKRADKTMNTDFEVPQYLFDMYTNISDKYRLTVRHFHKGNSSEKARHGKPYVTVATLKNRKDDHMAAYGISKCSKEDTPSRKYGYNRAVSSCLGNYYKVNYNAGSQAQP